MSALAAEAKALPREAFTAALPMACFILAFCSLNYEFLLAQMMAILGGHTVLFYSLTIGLYIFALGIGALVRVEGQARAATERRLFAVEAWLCCLGGGAPFLMVMLDHAMRAVLPPDAPLGLTVLPHACLVLVVGFLSGRELPMLLRLAEIRGVRSLITRLFAIDYLASFVGAVSFPLWLFPRFGMVAAASMLSLLSLIAMLLAVPVGKHPLRLATIGTLAVAALLLLWRSAVCEDWLSRALIG